MKYRLLISFFLTLVTAGCNFYAQDDYEQYYVVESYLIANRPLPHVRVSHTLPVEDKYSVEGSAVEDASVEIRLLDDDERIIEIYPYVYQKNGVYQPANPIEVQPQHVYELQVAINGGDEEITSRTFVPGAFQAEHQSETPDSVTYQSEEQIKINTSVSSYPGRQSYFIFTVNVIDPSLDRLTPFYEDQIDEDEEDLPDLYVNSSGVINEQNYEVNTDSTLTLRVPWLAVAFYGDNYITVNAIDDNMYDFIRSQGVQGGGSTLPPGEIQNIVYNVEGGIGIFGSMASDTVKVFIKQ